MNGLLVLVLSLFVVHSTAYCPANDTQFTSCATNPPGGSWSDCTGNVTFAFDPDIVSPDISCLSGISHIEAGSTVSLSLQNLTGDTVMDFTFASISCGFLSLRGTDHPIGTTLTINFGNTVTNQIGVALFEPAKFFGACGNIVMTAQSCSATPVMAVSGITGTLGDITLRCETAAFDTSSGAQDILSTPGSNVTVGDMTIAYGALTTTGIARLRGISFLGSGGGVVRSATLDAGTGCFPRLLMYSNENVGPITVRQPDCDMVQLDIGRSNEFMTPSSVSVTARSIATLNQEQTRGTDVTVTTTQNITSTQIQDVEGGVIRVTAPSSMADVGLNNVNASVSFEVCTGTVDAMLIENYVGGVVDTRAIKQLDDLDLDDFNIPDVLACDNFTITSGNATVSDCDTNNDGVPDLCASGGGGGGSTPSPASHFAAGPWPSLAALTLSALVPLMTLF